VRLRIGATGFVLVAMACGSGNERTVVGPPAPPPSATVTMTATQFLPDTTTIRVGGTVAFTNSAGILHDVDFGTPAFHIAAFDAGTRSLTFPTAGTLSFHCNLHAGMEATLVVR